VQGDPDELQQLGLNLVLNAMQASRSGDAISVVVRADSAEVSLLVADAGHGMTPEVRAQVFEPLFSTRGEAGGTGLGLTVVKGIADRHGASIEIETAERAGARFTLRFPRSHR
jgi:signal transduction histidine kinase